MESSSKTDDPPDNLLGKEEIADDKREGSSDEGESLDKKLFWAFMDDDGRMGKPCFFDEDTQKKMVEMLKQNPDSETAKFYLEIGISTIPILKEENLSLRNQMSGLEKELRETKVSLHEMTMDRNEKARTLMDAGSRKVGELYTVQVQKEAAELTVKGLKNEITALKKLLDEKEDQDEVLKRLDALTITVNNIKDDTGKIKQDAERSISIIGAANERRDKYLTPAADKLAGTGAKVILVAPQLLFKAIYSYGPLNRDMEKLMKDKVLTKITVNGNGLDMANDFMKKKHIQGGWEEGSFIVLVIDGVEGGVNAHLSKQKKTEQSESILSDSEEKILTSTAGILSLAVEATTAKAVLLIAGSSTKVEVIKAREHVFLQMANGNTTSFNMANRSGDNGEIEASDKWSALAAAELFSAIASWVESGYKKELNLRKVPKCCSDCGFVHGEGDSCFKDDIPVVREKEEDMKDENNHIKEEGRGNIGRSSSKRPPYCFSCGNFHFNDCRARSRYCNDCETNHAGKCRPETQKFANRGGGNEFKKKKGNY